MTSTIDRVTLDSLDDFVASVDGLFAEDAGTHDPAMDLGWPDRAGHAYYAALLGDEKTLCLLATTANGAAGHLIGKIAAPRGLRPGEVTAVLESMRVAEHARRTGVGSALITEFRKWAVEKNATEAKVTAFAANAGAIDFYRNNGFAPFELTLRSRLGG